MNWKTTTAGIATAVIAIGNAVLGIVNGTPVDWATTVAAITAAIGLFLAKDASKTE